MRTEIESQKLCAKWLRLGIAPKVIKKYQEARQGFTNKTCSSIGYNRQWNCNNNLPQCEVCIKTLESENYGCEVTRCLPRKIKIWIHLLQKYAKCAGNHLANDLRFLARQSFQAKAWKMHEIIRQKRLLIDKILKLLLTAIWIQRFLSKAWRIEKFLLKAKKIKKYLFNLFTKSMILSPI